MTYVTDSIRAEIIREEMKYEGVWIHLDSRLGDARVPLTIDIGFGDVITPRVGLADFPVLLGGETLRIRTYPRETVIAEKLEAMVALGQPNSRMKDFADIWFLSPHFAFDGKTTARAIAQTFACRGTAMPSIPLALTPEFASDASKQMQWSAFIRRTSPQGVPAELSEVVSNIAAFIGPIAKAIAAGVDFAGAWQPKGPWSG